MTFVDSRLPGLGTASERAAGEPEAARPARWRALVSLEWLPPAGRACALFVLSGASLAFWAQTAFRARWVKNFVLENQLDPGRHRLLLFWIAVGAGLGLLAWLALLIRLGVERGSAEKLEKLAWFLSPLIVSGALPILFRHSIWVGRALDLLLLTAVLAFSVEGLVRRSLSSIPERMGRDLEWLRERLPTFARARAATVAVCVGALGYSLYMTYWTILRHRKLQSAVFDLGISDNLMANALAGEFMRTPVFSGTAGGLDFLAGHFQIGQYVFLPIYALHPTAETLLGIQSFALGLSAIPLYFFSRRRLPAWTSALVALGFLAYHPMHGANFYEMTYLPVACPFVIGTIWALDARRYWVMVPLLAAALSMREDVSFGLAIAATGFVLANHVRRAALVVALVSAFYFCIVRFVIMPAAGTWCFPDLMYRELIPPGAPDTFGSVIKTLVTNPIYTFSKVATQAKLVFLLHLLVPVAFLPIRRAWLWVALVPGIVTTLLTTNYVPTISMGFHYPMEWAPYIWLAVPVGLAAIASATADGATRARAALVAAGVATAVLSFNFGAFAKHRDFKAGFSQFDFEYDAEHRVRHADLMTLVEKLPEHASVAVMERVGAHASNRAEAYSMRNGPQGAEYILVGKNDGVERERANLAAVLTATDYGVLERRGEFAILKRGADPSRNAELKREWRY